MNLQENIQRIREMMGVINEGLHDTSWENDKGDKVTLIDLLDATKDIPVNKISVPFLKPPERFIQTLWVLGALLPLHPET